MMEQQTKSKYTYFKSMSTITKKFNEIKDEKEQKLRLDDTSIIYQYLDIPLNLFYERCEVLHLRLKGFLTSQDDFDGFCGHFSMFNNLNELKFRFYNKHIQNMDELFSNILKIKKVELHIQDFKKIILTKEIPQSEIKELYLNLSNVTFNDSKSYKILQHFIGNQEKLKEITIQLNSINNIMLLSDQKKLDIKLKIYNDNLDIKFCDELIKVKEQQNLKLDILRVSLVLGIYLISKGLKFNHNYFSEGMTSYGLTGFSLSDIRRIKDVPQILEQFKEKKIFSFCFLFQQIPAVLQNIVKPLDFYTKNMNLYFDYYHQINKVGGIWKIEHQFEPQLLIKILKQADFMVNLDLKKQPECPIGYAIQQMKVISSFQYLIYYQFSIIQPPQMMNQRQDYKFAQDLLIEHKKVIQQKSIQKLRYIVFFKTIYQYLPLPQQIFFDLLDS